MIIEHELVGQDIVLRSLDPNQLSEQYLVWMNDPVVNQYMETRHKKWDLASIVSFVEDMNQSDHSLLLGIFHQGKHIGNIKLGPIQPYHKIAFLSLFIGEKDCWGKGYAAQAIQLFYRYAFEHYDLEKISASMYANNEGSLRAFLKVGFELEGMFKNHYTLEGDQRIDILQVGIVREQ